MVDCLGSRWLQVGRFRSCLKSTLLLKVCLTSRLRPAGFSIQSSGLGVALRTVLAPYGQACYRIIECSRGYAIASPPQNAKDVLKVSIASLFSV